MPRGPLLLALLVLLAALAAACEAGLGEEAEEEAEEEEEAGEEGIAVPEDVDEDDLVRVGLLNPSTGPFASLGEDVDDGFRLYLEEAGGELGGFAADVRLADEANDPELASERAAELAEDDGIDVAVGLVNSEVAVEATPVLTRAGVPLVITVAGADDLTQGDAAPSVFRVSATSSQDAMPLGAYACEELGYETVSLVALDYAFGWQAAGGFARAYTDAGCEVVDERYVPVDEEDWEPFLQELDTDADAVWAAAAGPDAIRLLQAYADVGIGLPLLGHGALTDEEVLAQQQALADGAITSLHYSAALDTPEARAFVAAFEEAYGRPASWAAEAGYAAAMVIDAALTGQDQATRARIIDALGEVEVDAPRGPLRFDEYGQAVHDVHVREVVEGPDAWRNEVVETFEDVSQFWRYDPEDYLERPRYEELRGTWPADGS
ncbi:MAG: ABC transporter substrate-binding protein [Egibacteraceae bacterium]